MDDNQKPYAGLVLPDAADLSLDNYFLTAARCLAALEPWSDRAPRINQRKQTVFGDSFALRFCAEENGDYGPRVMVTVLAREPGAETEEMSAKLLSDAVLAMLEHSSCDIIEWYSPDVLISREDFIRLRSYVSPLRGHGEFPEEQVVQQELVLNEVEAAEYQREQFLREEIRMPIEEDVSKPKVAEAPSMALSIMRDRIAENSPQENRMSAASWAMTGVLAVFNLPVAAALAVFGAARGMDFRLATQSLSVTMLFVAIYNSNDVGRMFQSILY